MAVGLMAVGLMTPSQLSADSSAGPGIGGPGIGGPGIGGPGIGGPGIGGTQDARRGATNLPDRHPHDPADPAVKQPPNIVLIVSDDQAWNDYGFMGHPHIQTPNLDRLASESLLFRRGYVPSSLCSPSLATLITGLYPHQHGITGNDPQRQGLTGAEYAQQRLRMISQVDRLSCLPEIMNQQANYLSFQSGKWWLGHHRRGGFTHGMTHGDPQRGGRHGDAGLKIGRQGLQPIVDFLDTAESAERPFLLWYAPFMPHTPHTPPQHLLDKYRSLTPHLPIAKYWAMCEWFDESVGQLLDELKRRQLDENTLVIYLADNGWINRTDRTAYAARSKRSPHEGGLRTPLMFRWPKQIEPADNARDLASSIDIVPTVLAAAGLDVPHPLPGINLLDEEALKNRDAIFGEVFDHDILDLDRPEASLQYRWIIQQHWKLIVANPQNVDTDDTIQLYNLNDDPHENRNLAQAHPEQVQPLRSELDRFWDPEESTGTTEREVPAARPPNLVFFMSDDQRNDALSIEGHPVVATPFIDDLARRGVRFRNAFVTTPICAASRASYLCGAWERSHGYTFGTPPLAEKWTAASYPSILRAAGYQTGFCGKLGVRTETAAGKQLFDYFQPLTPNPYIKQMPDGSSRHLTDLTADRAIEFLSQCSQGQPFCLTVWFNAPHAKDSDKQNHYPYPADEFGLYEDIPMPQPKISTDHWQQLPEFLRDSMHRDRWAWRWDTPEKFQRNLRAYYRMISGVDRNIGRVIREIHRRGWDEQTIIVFASDNGYYQGSRGLAGKWSHFDESLRIPLIVYDPRWSNQQRGQVRDELVLNVDVPATLLDLAGATLPASMQGRRLTDLTENRANSGPWREAFFCEHLFDHPRIPRWEGIRTSRWKYTRYVDQTSAAEFLHDLAKDPQELQNLATDTEFSKPLTRLREQVSKRAAELEQAK